MSVAHEDAAEAGRLLARARWGDRGLHKAVSVVLQRADLTDTTRDELQQIASPPDGDE